MLAARDLHVPPMVVVLWKFSGQLIDRDMGFPLVGITRHLRDVMAVRSFHIPPGLAFFMANSNYELGRGDKVGGWQPKLVSSLKDVRIIQIACGGYPSLALTDDGKALSWGHGGHGQLGPSSIQNQKVPTIIEALTHERVIFIACGGSSSAAVTETGKLYMWGNSKDSQLGVPGLPDIQPTPVEVKFLMEDDGLGPHRVLSVAIGASHAMCLVSRAVLGKTRLDFPIV